MEIAKKRKKKNPRKGISTTKYPITDVKLIRKLLEVPGRDGLFFHFMLYSGARASEILRLTWFDVLTIQTRPQVKKHLTFDCKKQSSMLGKLVTRTVPIPSDMSQRILEFWKSENHPALNELIFKARRNATGEPMNTQAAIMICKKWVCRLGNIPAEKVSSHMLRKTMARHYYERMFREGKDALMLTMVLLDHKNPGTTMRYIGLTQEEINATLQGEFYIDYKPLEALIERGEIDIKEIWFDIRRKNKKASPSELKLAFVKYFEGYQPEEVQRVIRLFYPMLKNLKDEI
jgi:integrase